jgi:hypothetical protein
MTARRKIKTEETGSYYVSVRNPVDTRRHLLESTKKVLMSLQNYQRLLLIRKEKQLRLEALKQSIKELGYLGGRLNSKLPQYDVQVLGALKKTRHEDVRTEQIRESKPPAVPKHEMTELDRLEASLRSIEEKLNSLD